MSFQIGRSALWTMPVEVTFYLLLIPFMIVLSLILNASQKKASLMFCCLGGILFFWCIYIISYDRTGIVATLGVHHYAPYFIFGAFIAALKNFFNKEIENSNDWIWNIVGLSALIFFIIQNPLWWQFIWPHEEWFYNPKKIEALTFDSFLYWRTYGMIPIVALIFLAADRQSGWLVSLFSSKFLTTVGKLSFPIYLLHMPIIFFVKDNITTEPLVGFLQICLITFLIAIPVHIFIEKPGIKLGKTIINYTLQKKLLHSVKIIK